MLAGREAENAVSHQKRSAGLHYSSKIRVKFWPFFVTDELAHLSIKYECVARQNLHSCGSWQPNCLHIIHHVFLWRSQSP